MEGFNVCLKISHKFFVNRYVSFVKINYLSCPNPKPF